MVFIRFEQPSGELFGNNQHGCFQYFYSSLRRYDVYLNTFEGEDDQDAVTGLAVIQTLESLNVPFTGADSNFTIPLVNKCNLLQRVVDDPDDLFNPFAYQPVEVQFPKGEAFMHMEINPNCGILYYGSDDRSSTDLPIPWDEHGQDRFPDRIFRLFHINPVAVAFRY